MPVYNVKLPAFSIPAETKSRIYVIRTQPVFRKEPIMANVGLLDLNGLRRGAAIVCYNPDAKDYHRLTQEALQKNFGEYVKIFGRNDQRVSIEMKQNATFTSDTR